MKFGRWIKAVRGLAGMNQVELAKFLGVSQAWVSKAERDQLEPSASQYLMLKALSEGVFKGTRNESRVA